MSFKGKVVIVTGGSSGIGAATAIFLSKEGANVVIVGRNELKLTNVAAECAKVGNSPLVIIADVSKEDDARTIIKKTIDTFGNLNVLVNNAGIARFTSVIAEDLLQTYDEVMNVNLRAAVHLTNLAAPFLTKTKGNVVNVSSIFGLTILGMPKFMAYSISKAGLDIFTKAAALDLAPSGVRVNSVNPGPVKTSIFENGGYESDWGKWACASPLQKVCDSEEVANLIAFIASDKAKSVTGSIYVIDNGVMLKYNK